MAIAITTETKAAWNKAIEKAKSVKPRVTVLGQGQFKVCGSKGDCYNVTWTGHKGAELKATCDCPAGRKNKPCYHIPPTAGIFKLQVKERAEKARQDSLATCSQCHEVMPEKDLSADGLCGNCILFG